MSDKTNFVFQRIEAKYMIPKMKYEAFRREMEGYMQLDEYGLSTICNIYYDTEHYDLVSRSLEKPRYKEKLRLRSYGVPDKDSRVFIELKKKYDGIVYKRRTDMILRDAEAFLNEGAEAWDDTQINREIKYFLDFYRPVPAMVLCYDREAFFGKEDPEMRMTIDRNIRFREKDLYLEHGDYGELIDPDGDYLLEIKVGHAMPIWLARLFSEYEIFPVSFSKYGKIYSITHEPSMTGNLFAAQGFEKKAMEKVFTEPHSERGRAVCSQVF